MRGLLLICCLCIASPGFADHIPATTVSADPSPAVLAPAEPGPESQGLRLRLSVIPRGDAGAAGYRIRVDLLNVSPREILVRAAWPNDGPEDLKAYLEAATSIECVPAIAPWIGGVPQGQRSTPQPKQLLKAGETISVSWQTDQPRLKNRVTNPNEVQNPTFHYPGLYSVHATLQVSMNGGPAMLRSNEQLVPVGGSRGMPKPTIGSLHSVDDEKKTATLSLGSLQQVAVGDQFEIGHPKGMHWKLTITGVGSRWSWGNLELLTTSKHPPFRDPPSQNMTAVLVNPK